MFNNEFEYAYQKGYEEAQAYMQGYLDKTASILETEGSSSIEKDAHEELVTYVSRNY